MHGNDNGDGVAAVCARVGQPPSHGLSQRTDAWRPLVTGSSQHGARLAHPPQPSTNQRQPTDDCQANVDGVRPSGDGNRCYESQPFTKERLAPVGDTPGKTGQPVHPQTSENVVMVGQPTGPVSTDNVLRLLEHQHYRCALTGRVLTPETASIDHILPIRLGGTHTIENAQVLHKDVNRAKGSMTSEEFVGLCREVARWSETVESREEMRP